MNRPANSQPGPRRRYTLKKRAERQDETRLRIIEATIALHKTLGPASTTISAIARKAGVQRLTLYRHFPDKSSLLRACRGYDTARNPLPDPVEWAKVSDPTARLRGALAQLYAYYRINQDGMAAILRDAEVIPGAGGGFLSAAQAFADVLASAPWRVRGARRQRLHAVLGHATDFQAWRSFAVRQRLPDTAIIDLMAALAGAIADLSKGDRRHVGAELM
jgi:AcrR family transcriptional regulator